MSDGVLINDETWCGRQSRYLSAAADVPDMERCWGAQYEEQLRVLTKNASSAIDDTAT